MAETKAPFAVGAALALFLVVSAAPAGAQIGARPQAALAPPPDLCIRDVQVGVAAGAVRATLVVRDGRITEQLAADAPLPAGAVEIDGAGLLALPAFVDAFTPRGVATPAPEPERDAPLDARADALVDMRVALRRGLSPAFRAVDVATLEDDHLAEWRAAGFGYALQSPSGQFLSGQAALVSLRDGALRERVVQADAAQHASFSSNGSGYPSTLMGCFAHLRQFALDAEHWMELTRRRADGRAAPRPAYDRDLEAALGLAAGERLVLCEAESATDVRRWLRLAEELGWRLVVLGGRESGEEAPALAARRVPVVLTLDWAEEVADPRKPKTERGGKARGAGEEKAKGAAQPEAVDEPPAAGDAATPDAAPDEAAEEPAPPHEPELEPTDAAQEPPEPTAAPSQDAADAASAADAAGDDAPEVAPARAKYVEPYEVRLARRLEWEERQKSAIALAEAGVPFAFGSGEDGPKELLGRVRELVEAGLDQGAALAALTTRAAELFGERAIGRLEPGADASFALWTANPLVDAKARVEWHVVEGHAWRAPPEKKDEKPSKPEDER